MLTLAAGLFGLQSWANVLPGAATPLLPQAQAAGQARMSWWGLSLYDARLWVAPQFRHGDFARHGFALELAYLREFRAADIARRSIDEMRRVGAFTAEQAQRWERALTSLLPDVKAGDRILGVHQPGRGATFLVNGQPAGEVADPEFARLFFGIWLAPQTSEPRLREALLSGTTP